MKTVTDSTLFGRSERSVVSSVTEHFWRCEVSYELCAFEGTEPGEGRVVLQARERGERSGGRNWHGERREEREVKREREATGKEERGGMDGAKRRAASEIHRGRLGGGSG